MATILAIAVFSGIAAAGAFIGTSLANLLFKSSKAEEKTTNELKNEIHVLSADIKGISAMEIIIIALIVFVSTAIVCIAIIWCILKKCRKSDNISLSREGRRVQSNQRIESTDSSNV